MRPGPLSRDAARPPNPDVHAAARQLFAARYTAISGHCIYCGAFSWGRLCQAHKDLPPADPLFAPTIVALTR